MEPQRQFLREYALGGGVGAVSGWLADGAISAILAISERQKQHGIEGSVAEIGVHHGKLFILLKNLCAEQEFAIAVDVFEDQHLNPDHSGHGDRDTFEKNLQKHTDGKNIIILTKDSMTLTPDDFGDCKVRIFSVDGSHTAEHTINDLEFATSMLVPGGVVVLDDFYNQDWPGVQEGFYRFMCRHGQEFAAVAYGDNKMIIASHNDHRFLYDFFMHYLARFASYHKPVVIHGSDSVRYSMKPPSEVFDQGDMRLRQDVLPQTTVPFYLTKGWGNVEPVGVWSIDSLTKLEVELVDNPRSLTFSVRPFLPAGRSRRRVKVSLGDRIVATRELAGSQDIAIDLPAGSSGRVTLSFDIEHPDRPADFGGKDLRPLGILLTGIKQSN
jgi:Methyltransferase domain